MGCSDGWALLRKFPVRYVTRDQTVLGYLYNMIRYVTRHQTVLNWGAIYYLISGHYLSQFTNKVGIGLSGP